MKKVKAWKIKHSLTVGLQEFLSGNLVYLQFSDPFLDGWYNVNDIKYLGEYTSTENRFTSTYS